MIALKNPAISISKGSEKIAGILIGSISQYLG